MIPALLPVYKRVNIDFTHGTGMYLFDGEGNQYLDLAAGYAANSLGHCHPTLVSALTAQLNKIWHISNKYTIPGLLEYCQKLTEISFADTAFIASSGAEAVECMIKMGRCYFNAQGKAEKFRFITFDGAFHGRTMACISAGGKEKIKGFEPALDGFDRVPWGDIEAVKSAITPNTAGILIEPIQGEGGMRACTQEFMKALRHLCDQHDLLLMLDEVQCGMGRTGYIFAYEMYNIVPDIVALGKGLGCGFPISACLTTTHIGKHMYVGSHGSTFGGNPLAVAVGNAVLKIMSDPEFLPHIRRISLYLQDKLTHLAHMHPQIIHSITGHGLMLGINLHPDYDAETATKICAEELLLSMPASNNVLRITPPLIITEGHCDEALTKLNKVMTRLSSPTTTLITKISKAAKTLKTKLGFE